MNNISIYIIAALAISIATLGIGIYVLIGNFCSNDLQAEIYSPSKNMKSIVFQRDCGATTSFSTQVSVFPAASKQQNEKGNIFIADTNHGEAPAAPWGGPNIKVEWLNNRTLQIEKHEKTRVFKAESSYQEIHVEYMDTTKAANN